MFLQSWKLSIVAFISVPAIVVISKRYGEYIRKLSVKTQEKLAEANSVAEEALSSMSTIRCFACEDEEGGSVGRGAGEGRPTKRSWVITFSSVRCSAYSCQGGSTRRS